MMCARSDSSMSGQQGFTLLELLVAISILVVLGAMSYIGLKQVVFATEINEEAAANLVQLEKTFYWMSRDLGQISSRPALDRMGDRQPALLADPSGEMPSLTLTRTRALQDGEAGGKGFERITWHVRDGQLLRSVEETIDAADRVEPVNGVLAEGIEQFELRIYRERWLYSWPQPDTAPEELPQAVQVSLTLDGLGTVTRLFRLVK